MKRKTKRERYGIPSCTEYQIWNGMWERCHYPDCKAYERYGARGVSVCERWRDFFLFVQDMGRRPSKNHSLDRIKTAGNYEPGNCKWSTPIEQAGNREFCIQVTLDGVTRTHTAWCRLLGVTRETTLRRFKDCGDWEKAFKLAKFDRTEERKELVTIDGETRSIQGWCKLIGIPSAVIWKRILGESQPAEQAIRNVIQELEQPSLGNQPVTINGKTKLLAEWCREHAIYIRTAMRRHAHWGDWNKVFTLSLYLPRMNSGIIKAFGRTRTIQQWSNETGLPPRLIWERINRHLMSPEQALTKGRTNHDQKNAIKITINGVTDSLNGWCIKTGTPRTTATRRFKRCRDWTKVFNKQSNHPA